MIGASKTTGMPLSTAIYNYANKSAQFHYLATTAKLLPRHSGESLKSGASCP
jgi:hypothetical protein